MRRSLAACLAVALSASRAAGAVYTVAGSGGDFTSIQEALNAAVAGDTVQVRAKGTPYFEKVGFPRSGSSGAGFVTLEAYPGEQPVLDGTGVAGESMILIDSRSWIRVRGLEIRNNLGVHDGSGIRVIGSGSHIELRDNHIHDMRGANAMGITVYGTEVAPISDLVVDGNTIHDCEPAPSEALTLNGNVAGFAVTNNVVHDVDNIGIDFIGGETDIQPDPTKVARDGVCRGNTVTRARSIYGGGFAGGIYVDGGRDIVIENNVVTESDLGLEVGAENAGTTTTGIVVRNNVLHANDKAGLVFGGYAASVGRVKLCTFEGNTVTGNDTLGAGFGELWIQYAEDNLVRNNVFHAGGRSRLLTSDAGNLGNALDYNVWFTTAATAEFVWNGTEHTGFAAYRAATGGDAHSAFADPLLAGDFHLLPGSPAVDAGDPAFAPAVGETDLDRAPRVNGPRVDAGADEASTCGDGTVQPPETCDDTNTIDGDGCDSNCTVTGCGNQVVTAGEQCDDGNTAAGDCCSPMCALDAPGTACDDGDPCTSADACATGACAGSAEPAGGCRTAPSGSVTLRDRSPDTKDQIVWKWTHGTATTLPELGNPAGGATAYAFCVYDRTAGVPAVRARALVPAGGVCRGKPCWKPSGATGLRYANRDGTADGVTKLVLKSGAAGAASIAFTAKGGRVDLPALPLAQDPTVTVQIRRLDSPICWESSFSAPASRADATQFVDRLP